MSLIFTFCKCDFHVVTIFENILLWEEQLQMKDTLWIQLMVEIRWYGQKTLLSNLAKRSHLAIDFIIKCTKLAYLWSLILNVKRYIYKYLKFVMLEVSISLKNIIETPLCDLYIFFSFQFITMFSQKIHHYVIYFILF